MSIRTAFPAPSQPWRGHFLGEPMLSDWSSRLQRLSCRLMLTSLLLGSPFCFAQAHKSGASAEPTVKTVSSGPAWRELTPFQQQALAPLASNWDTISEPQKRKWLEISKSYLAMTPEGRATLNSRMNEWVELSPHQRAQARLNFGKTKELSRQLTPEEKKAKWQAYQALSPEEKQKLVAKSPKASGAAPAIKPVAVHKLAQITPHTNKVSARPAPKIVPSPPAAASIPPASTAGEAISGGTHATPEHP